MSYCFHVILLGGGGERGLGLVKRGRCLGEAFRSAGLDEGEEGGGGGGAAFNPAPSIPSSLREKKNRVPRS